MIFSRLFKCKHQVDTYGSNPVYGRIQSLTVDGMGVEHAVVWVRCRKCGKEFEAAMLHLPKAKRA